MVLTFGTGFNNFLTSPTINISAAGAITGATGLTTIGNITQTGSGTFSTGTGAVSLNGATTVVGGSNFTLASGNGVFSQTYSSGTNGTSAQVLGVTNSNTSTTSTTVNGINLNLSNATNTHNSNTLNGIDFAAATNNNSNLINGINFESAIGFNNFLSTPTLPSLLQAQLPEQRVLQQQVISLKLVAGHFQPAPVV